MLRNGQPSNTSNYEKHHICKISETPFHFHHRSSRSNRPRWCLRSDNSQRGFPGGTGYPESLSMKVTPTNSYLDPCTHKMSWSSSDSTSSDILQWHRDRRNSMRRRHPLFEHIFHIDLRDECIPSGNCNLDNYIFPKMAGWSFEFNLTRVNIEISDACSKFDRYLGIWILRYLAIRKFDYHKRSFVGKISWSSQPFPRF